MNEIEYWAPYEAQRARLTEITLDHLFTIPSGAEFRKLLAFRMDATGVSVGGDWKDIAGALDMTDAEIRVIETKVFQGGLSRYVSPIELVLARIGRRGSLWSVIEALRAEGRWDILRECVPFILPVCDEVELKVKTQTEDEFVDDAASASALEESFGLSPLLDPFATGNFILVVAAEDGFDLADKFCDSVKTKKCITLNSPEADLAMFIDVEGFALSSFRKAKNIVPIITPEYIKVISVKNRGVYEEIMPLNKSLRRLHDFMDQEVLRWGRNFRVKPLVSNEVVLARSKALDRVSYLKNWCGENGMSRLASLVSQ